ncbi:hypothetical protein ACPWSR_00680 [Alloiococcus sp. CFN-8]|uniref:hypothetical protein n=1 Tax=Alloiococcus sp. CFN-8 TaxID=3416081 RepID=UPI003CF4E5D9
MKISKREKNLLLFLGVLIIFFGYYKLIFIKQREEVSQLKLQRIELTDKLNTIEKSISSLDSLKTKAEEASERISIKTNKLYPYLSQNNIIVELDKLLREAGIIGNMTFAMPTLESLQGSDTAQEEASSSVLKPIAEEYKGLNNTEDKTLEKTQEKEDGSSLEGGSVESLKVNLSFNGNYNNYIRFMQLLENNSKRIFISSLSLSQNTQEEVAGTLTLDFYAVPKITDEDDSYGEWAFNNSYGKENPFTGSAVAAFKNTIEESAVEKEESYDFAISLKSIDSDLPTFMLGKAKDAAKATYVYDDSEGVIEAEIVFTEKEGAYYYKYKTPQGNYPLKYDGEGIKFVPNSNSIIINVYSSERTGDKDSSAANLKIINKTDKSVLVNVENDPIDTPRLTVTGDGGNVDVKRN